jgi:uncharacterized protein YraI
LTGAGLAAALVAAPALARPGVATGNVNMRVDPTVQAPRITTIPEGARVEIHGCPSWCNVTYRGRTGWVSSNYVAGARYRPAPPPPPVYYQPRPPRYYDRPHHRRHHWHGDDWRYRRGPSFSFGFEL